ncbi:ORF6N domain-containing protein [Clostridiaceae bacterium]|nr:ORF6N domain-containing protein [Clostridiaceae bacterium]
MNELIKINGREIAAKEWQGLRVVTLKDIDFVHERPEGTARKRFNDNKERFVEGEDFFKVKCSEVRPFFGQTPPNGFNPDADIVLITESGYLMLVKSFSDDLAWKVQRDLVNTYFRARAAVADFSHLSPQLQTLINLETEQRRQAALLEAVA